MIERTARLRAWLAKNEARHMRTKGTFLDTTITLIHEYGKTVIIGRPEAWIPDNEKNE